ncbi:hypothetical protein HK099_002439 [Clydaea vesicula]|uniref:Nascent polypeptide-associated complex subunit beta n=1 Tax=Clydaea vesicula TaxID=447962 RepID=A0AAD5U2Y6_9FUNG|nr:hypothetical protein HK099_002439 [Clydaea vesicula]
MNPERLAKLQANAASVRIGGKGTARRKVKKVHKTASGDDKKLQTALKKLNMQPLAGIEEVNMFKQDGTVLHFINPKVECSVAHSTLSIQGAGEVKELGELVPGILSQLGPDSLNSLKKLAENFQQAAKGGLDSNDDDVPDLVENLSDEDLKFVHEIEDSDEYLLHKGKWLILFYAEWNEDSLKVSKEFSNYKNLPNDLNVAKIDMNKNRVTSTRFIINKLPQIFFLNNYEGEEAKNKRQLRSLKELSPTCFKEKCVLNWLGNDWGEKEIDYWFDPFGFYGNLLGFGVNMFFGFLKFWWLFVFLAVASVAYQYYIAISTTLKKNEFHESYDSLSDFAKDKKKKI